MNSGPKSLPLVLAFFAGFQGATATAAANASKSPPTSRPEFVTPACRAAANAGACSVALRYLAALDLDRPREACRLLDPPTLAAAGGMRGCTKTLSRGRGIRIRYAITAALPSPLGRTIRFWTRAGHRSAVRQQMLISPAGRIIAIVPEP